MKKSLKIISSILIFSGITIIMYTLIFDYQQTIGTLSNQNGRDIIINKTEDINSPQSTSTSTLSKSKLPNSKSTVNTPFNPNPVSTYKLTIPSIGVNINIVFGEDEAEAFRRGAWHFPGSGTPNDPNDYKNIVISAHRYLYTSGPNTFFNLDKVKKDDLITIKWDEEEYQYKVNKIHIVEPTEISILKDTGVEKLTLFTCHPAFTTEQRLVVEAYPLEESN